MRSGILFITIMLVYEVKSLLCITTSSTTGAYEARIEVCDEVMSAFNSAKEMELEVVKLYHVTRLVKVE